mmetsp:Transcript_72963/g.217763  ORF Transcript_72963/g.217763 Transcript_72963/m.217763 type:complete len:332 (+) Transcript_72963:178-1173(+)
MPSAFLRAVLPPGPPTAARPTRAPKASGRSDRSPTSWPSLPVSLRTRKKHMRAASTMANRWYHSARHDLRLANGTTPASAGAKQGRGRAPCQSSCPPSLRTLTRSEFLTPRISSTWSGACTIWLVSDRIVKVKARATEPSSATSVCLSVPEELGHSTCSSEGESDLSALSTESTLRPSTESSVLPGSVTFESEMRLAALAAALHGEGMMSEKADPAAAPAPRRPGSPSASPPACACGLGAGPSSSEHAREILSTIAWTPAAPSSPRRDGPAVSPALLPAGVVSRRASSLSPFGVSPTVPLALRGELADRRLPLSLLPCTLLASGRAKYLDC